MIWHYEIPATRREAARGWQNVLMRHIDLVRITDLAWVAAQLMRHHDAYTHGVSA